MLPLLSLGEAARDSGLKAQLAQKGRVPRLACTPTGPLQITVGDHDPLGPLHFSTLIIQHTAYRKPPVRSARSRALRSVLGACLPSSCPRFSASLPRRGSVVCRDLLAIITTAVVDSKFQDSCECGPNAHTVLFYALLIL